MLRVSQIAIIVFLILGTAGLLSAEYAPYNRPNPLMDYVPQEIGIYDTVYWELRESDCRGCHGNSVADRHHLTKTVLEDNLCSPCHAEIDVPPFIVAIRDCTTSGCHSWDDLDTNGWHHKTDLSASDSCISCHNPNVIQEITPIRDFETYPPSMVTPTPYSCENCHWRQDLVPGGDPDSPGHPSTYDHYDSWGNWVGFQEYGKPIYSNFDTHHMGFSGNVTSSCDTCHALEAGHPDWNPDNPQLIRACEICHSANSLHTIRPHIQDGNGWEAVGFHVLDWNTQTRDLDPTVYRTWNYTGPYLPETSNGFTINHMCFGCHGDGIPEPPPLDDCNGNAPVIDNTVAGIQPQYGTCGAIVTLRGQQFGPEQISGRKVEMRRKEGGTWIGDWTELPVVSWVDTRIEFHIPCFTFEPGNYRVRVETECGKSNRVYFGLKDWISASHISPESGPCGQWITVTGDSFGLVQSKMLADGYFGVHRMVDFVSSQGTFTALQYRAWTDHSFKVRFYKFFEDGQDPHTGDRNFVQDDGSGSCPLESDIVNCGDLALGVWSLYVKAIYFGDDDGSGILSCGDTIFQVVVTNPQYFELTNEPIIYRLNPDQIERGGRLRLIGLNFGPSQTDGEVRIGSELEAQDPVLGQGVLLDHIIAWSNTIIRVKVQRVTVPKGWEGTTKYVWVEKDGTKSNYRKLEILEPLP